MTTTWLADKSALVRPGSSPDAEEWASRLERGLVHITTVTRDEHRAPSIPDLIIAATAELAGPATLHADEDCDLIAAVTWQRMERLAL